MKKKFYMIILFAFSIHVMAEEACQLITFEGEVLIRKPFENQYQVPSAGMALDDKMVLNANLQSKASIRTYDGSVFKLPANAQIEVDELKKRNRNDLLMLLTGLEMQQLPDKNAVQTQQTAFVLHGAVSGQSDATSQEQVALYIQKEINGAHTLYEQGFVAGFILKVTRLQMVFPELNNQELNTLLIRAFDEMKMPFRKQKFIEKIQNK